MPTDRATPAEPDPDAASDDALLPILATAGRAPRRNTDRYIVAPDGSIERRVQKRPVHPVFERRTASESGVDVAS